MKAIRIILIFLFCLGTSCKKTEKIDCWFNFNPPNIYRNSISGIVINYSKYSNERDMWDSINYQFSVQTEKKKSGCDTYPCSIDYGFITLEVGSWYVIKKFDLIDSSGKTLFYMTWQPDSLHKTANAAYLPYFFKATGRVFLDFTKLKSQ